MQTKKIVAGIVGNRKIHLIDIFSVFLHDYHMIGYNRAEIIEEQTCPYLHLNIFTLL